MSCAIHSIRYIKHNFFNLFSATKLINARIQITAYPDVFAYFWRPALDVIPYFFHICHYLQSSAHLIYGRTLLLLPNQGRYSKILSFQRSCLSSIHKIRMNMVYFHVTIPHNFRMVNKIIVENSPQNIQIFSRFKL